MGADGTVALNHADQVPVVLIAEEALPSLVARALTLQLGPLRTRARPGQLPVRARPGPRRSAGDHPWQAAQRAERGAATSAGSGEQGHDKAPGAPYGGAGGAAGRQVELLLTRGPHSAALDKTYFLDPEGHWASTQHEDRGQRLLAGAQNLSEAAEGKRKCPARRGRRPSVQDGRLTAGT